MSGTYVFTRQRDILQFKIAETLERNITSLRSLFIPAPSHQKAMLLVATHHASSRHIQTVYILSPWLSFGMNLQCRLCIQVLIGTTFYNLNVLQSCMTPISFMRARNGTEASWSHWGHSLKRRRPVGCKSNRLGAMGSRWWWKKPINWLYNIII